MVKQYVSYEMDAMIDTAIFRDMLGADRDFLDDFCSQVDKSI